MSACILRRLSLTAVALLALLCDGQAAFAETEAASSIDKLRAFFALPTELDFDNGAENGNANILRIMPLYTFPVFERWKLVHLDIITLADAPSGTPAFPGDPSIEPAAGLSDLMHASFVTPTSTNNFIWGIGAMASLPTATDKSLGSGKWTVGPAVRLTYRTERWNLGLIAAQRWSFAGSGNRKDVSQLLMRGLFRRQLPGDWFFVSAPLIVANWDSPEQKWLVPMGGGIGRKFTLSKYPWAWSVQGYYNVIKPDTAPDWVVRFAIIAAIPFGEN